MTSGRPKRAGFRDNRVVHGLSALPACHAWTPSSGLGLGAGPPHPGASGCPEGDRRAATCRLATAPQLRELRGVASAPATLWAVRPDGQEGRLRLPACGDAGNVPAFVIRGPSRAAGSNARTSHRHALEKTTRQPAPRFLSKRGMWASRWKGVALSRREGQWGSPASFGELVPKRRAHQHRGAIRHLSVVIVFTGSNSVLRS